MKACQTPSDTVIRWHMVSGKPRCVQAAVEDKRELKEGKQELSM